MPDPALDWLDDLPDLRVPGVLGVPAQFSAIPAGTPQKIAGVPGVLDDGRNTLEHGRNTSTSTSKLLILHKEHGEHLGTPKSDMGMSISGVPAEIVEGVALLKRAAPPRISRPDAWREIVSDAARLLSQGWAAKALALGWSPMELFGASPAIGGDQTLDGMAVWLSARRLLLIDEKHAIVADGIRRFTFRRFSPKGAAFLWELADIQRRRKRR